MQYFEILLFQIFLSCPGPRTLMLPRSEEFDRCFFRKPKHRSQKAGEPHLPRRGSFRLAL